MINLYADYIAEREGLSLAMIGEVGFYTYTEIEGNSLYLIDMFIAKESRKAGIAKGIIKELLTKYDKIVTQSDTNAKNWQDSHNTIIAVGFKPVKTKDSLIYYLIERG